MIPKKIHYIWLGKKKKSKLTEICINSWKRHLPGFEIIEWNENNINISELCDKNKFFRVCYELKMWAFVSDYLRLWILNKEGGIYLDTDVELVKSLEPLLDNEGFMGYEEGGFICTAVIGSVSDNPLLKRILSFYDKEIWNVSYINNPIIFRNIQESEPELFSKCTLYTQDYFSPYVPGVVYDDVIEKEKTYTIHWYTGDWNISREAYVFMHTKHIKNPIIKFLEVIKKNIGYFKKYRKI